MKKESELIKITPDSYKTDDLRPGAEVINLIDIKSPIGEGVITKGSKFRVVRLLDQRKYQGGFVINFEGEEWGFYLGKGAEWWGIIKEDENEDEINIEYLIGGEGDIDVGISEFETIPYNIYKVLIGEQVIERKDLVERVIILEAPHPSSRRSIKNTINSAIDNLINRGYLVLLRHSEKIMMTPSGKDFFEKEDNTTEGVEKSINKDILIKELNKGKTIIVDETDIISKLQQKPNEYFLVQNEKGTYDLGAIYDERINDWIVARKYRRDI